MMNNTNEVNEKYHFFFNEEVNISKEKVSSWGLFKKIKISLSLFLYTFLIKDYHLFYNFKNPKYYNSAKGAILTFFKKDMCESSTLVKLVNLVIFSILFISGIGIYLTSLSFIPFYSLTNLIIAVSLSLGVSASYFYLKSTRQLVFAALIKAIKAVFKNQSILTYYHMKEEGLNMPVNQEKLSFLLNSDIRGKEHPVFVDMLVDNKFKYITLNDLSKVNVEYITKRNEKLDVLLCEAVNQNFKNEPKNKIKMKPLNTENHKKAAIILSALK